MFYGQVQITSYVLSFVNNILNREPETQLRLVEGLRLVTLVTQPRTPTSTVNSYCLTTRHSSETGMGAMCFVFYALV